MDRQGTVCEDWVAGPRRKQSSWLGKTLRSALAWSYFLVSGAGSGEDIPGCGDHLQRYRGE